MRAGGIGLGTTVALAIAIATASAVGGGGGSVTCLVSNRASWSLGGTNCVYGTTITQTNTAWHCTAALSTYGTLPIKVVSNWTSSVNDNAVTFDNGCTGDSNPDTIDVILEINGAGATSGVGPQDDAAKFRQSPGPSNLQVTGIFNCGAPGGTSHPDTWQFQGGTNLAIVNGKSGDWSAGTSTCQGAGGAIFWTNTTDVDIYGGEYVTCNHGLNGNSALVGALQSVTGSKFRTGRTDGTDANCTGYSASPPCINTTGMTLTSVTCEQWLSSSWTTVAPQEFGNLWVDTDGGTCTRSGTAAVYSTSTACASLSAALTASTSGDSVIVKAGTYPGELIGGSPTKTIQFWGENAGRPSFGQIISNGSNITLGHLTVENRAITWDGNTCYWDYTLVICGNTWTLNDVVVDGLEKGKPEGDSNRLGGIQVTGNNHTFTRVEVKNIRDNKGFQGGGDNLVVQDSLFHDVALTTEGAAADVHLECAAVTEGNNQIWRRNKFYRCGQINWVSQNYVGGPAFGPVTLENNWFAHPILNETAFAWQAGAPCLSLTLGNGGSNNWTGWVVRNNTFECDITVVDTAASAGSASWYGNLGVDPGCGGDFAVSYNVGSVCSTGTGNTVVANALNTDSAQNQAPFYVDAPANNFHLNSTSAAIDKGNPSTYPALDIDGESRYKGSAPDAGGDERW